MIIWHGTGEIQDFCDASIVTIGVFDGVHRGHQRLINAAVALAREENVPSIMVTFDPHPRQVFAPETAPAMLTTPAQRERMSSALGIDATLVIDFNRELAGMSPEEYFRSLLVESLHARHIVVGSNFTFGANAAGTAQTMVELGKKYAVEVTIVDLLIDDSEQISSTNIRSHLASGNIGRANWALGRTYSLTGEIVRGAGRGGKELGYPTANQYFPDSVVVPADGVYAGWFVVEGDVFVHGDIKPGMAHPAAISVGTNPTFGDARRSVESFVLDRDSDLYGRIATVYFVDKVRDMEKFNSVDDLLHYMARDVEKTRAILTQAPRPELPGL